jgi:hypothetical protein
MPELSTLGGGSLMKSKLRRLFLFFVLGLGALHGVAMDPKKIEELLDTMNQTKIEMTIQGQNDEDKSKQSGT